MAKLGAYWRVSPKNMGKAITAGLNEFTEERAREVMRQAIHFSPVDSGAYRASWVLSVGKPSYNWVGRHRHLSGKGTPLSPPSIPYRLTSQEFAKYYVTNGAPYAYRLEQGWSDQAPYGIIREILQGMK